MPQQAVVGMYEIYNLDIKGSVVLLYVRDDLLFYKVCFLYYEGSFIHFLDGYTGRNKNHRQNTEPVDCGLIEDTMRYY